MTRAKLNKRISPDVKINKTLESQYDSSNKKDQQNYETLSFRCYDDKFNVGKNNEPFTKDNSNSVEILQSHINDNNKNSTLSLK